MTDDALAEVDRRLIGYETIGWPENGSLLDDLVAVGLDVAGGLGHMAAMERARRRHAAAEGIEYGE